MDDKSMKIAKVKYGKAFAKYYSYLIKWGKKKEHL